VVSEKVRYTYPNSAQSYQELFSQTRYVSEQEAEQIEQQVVAKAAAVDRSNQKQLDKEYIDKACEIIQDCENNSSNTRTNIRDKLSDVTALSRKGAEAILDTYTGDSWICNETLKNNAKTYSVIRKNETKDFKFPKLSLTNDEYPGDPS
jgi:ssRNA-specific RNase YbeY (16S rRNA maturation enzyme)